MCKITRSVELELTSDKSLAIQKPKPLKEKRRYYLAMNDPYVLVMKTNISFESCLRSSESISKSDPSDSHAYFAKWHKIRFATVNVVTKLIFSFFVPHTLSHIDQLTRITHSETRTQDQDLGSGFLNPWSLNEQSLHPQKRRHDDKSLQAITSTLRVYCYFKLASILVSFN